MEWKIKKYEGNVKYPFTSFHNFSHEKFCYGCGKELEPTGCYGSRRNNVTKSVFCSARCRHEYRLSRMLIQDSEPFIHKFKCKNCGEIAIFSYNRKPRQLAEFCSSQCNGEYRRKYYD